MLPSSNLLVSLSCWSYFGLDWPLELEWISPPGCLVITLLDIIWLITPMGFAFVSTASWEPLIHQRSSTLFFSLFTVFQSHPLLPWAPVGLSPYDALSASHIELAGQMGIQTLSPIQQMLLKAMDWVTMILILQSALYKSGRAEHSILSSVDSQKGWNEWGSDFF